MEREVPAHSVVDDAEEGVEDKGMHLLRHHHRYTSIKDV